jgi:hypothetical protein
MTWRQRGVFCVLFTSACGGVTAPSDTSTPAGAAGLERRTLAATHFFGNAPDKTTIAGPVSSVVGTGVELRNFGVTVFVNGQPTSGFVDIDFSNTNILVSLVRDQAPGYFDTLRFSMTNQTGGAFASVTMNPATDYSGFTGARISVSRETIDLNLTSLRGVNGQKISLDVSVTAVGSVP